jgi:hypothetical protein
VVMKQGGVKKNNKKAESKFVSVKISRTSYNKLVDNKSSSGVPISVQIDKLVENI